MPKLVAVAMHQLDEFYGPNAGYAAELLDNEQQQELAAAAPLDLPSAQDTGQLSQAAAASALAQGIRLFGHRGCTFAGEVLVRPDGDDDADHAGSPGWCGM